VPPDAIRPQRTLWLLSAAHAVNHAQAVLLPLIFLRIIDEFGVGVQEVTFVAAAGAIASGVIQASYASLTRRMARRPILAAGGLVFGLGFAMQAAASSFLAFAVTNVVSRVGGSPQHYVGNGLLAEQFPEERRGFAISAHISGGNVGTILVPFVGGALLAAFSWQLTLVLFGIPALLVGTLMALRVREDGQAYRTSARQAGSMREQLRAVLGRGDLRLLLGAAMVAAGGRGLDILAPFMLLYFRGPLGIDESTTRWLYALLLVGAVVGPLLAGWLSDRLGRRRTLVSYYGLSAIGIVLFLAAGSNLVLLAPLLLPFGTAVFSESPILQAYLADRATGPSRDVAFSVYFTCAFGIGALWAFVIGSVVSAWGYPVAFTIMAGSYLAAALLLLAIRDRPAGTVPAS